MKQLHLYLVGLLSLCLVSSVAVAQVLSSEWSNAPIGGGGRTVGFIGSPTSDMLYLRTDVAGMYKKRSSDTEWTRLTETFTPDYGERMVGSAGLGVHPTDDDILYAALSQGIYKSKDQGRSWSQVLEVDVLPNGAPYNRDDRNYGEALVVDQYNGEVVYYGSQRDGLFYTRDGGKNWIQLPNEQIPYDSGSRNIITDNVRAQQDGRAKFVYVGVRNQGIYRSTDGGTSFSQWQATLPGGGDYVRWLRQSKEGDLYAAHEKGLARWDGENWTDISPVPGSEVTAVDTDPLDDTQVICFTFDTEGQGNIYRSRDRGQSWEIAPYIVGDLPPWAAARGIYAPGQNTTFALYFDDQSEGENNQAYVCSNYFPWETDDVWAPEVLWDAMYEGNEMTINISGVSLPEGKAPYIAGMADVRGFKYEDITQYPEGPLNIDQSDLAAGFFTPNFTGMDFSAQQPQTLWFVGNKKGGAPPYDVVYRSDDSGNSLQYVSSPSLTETWGDARRGADIGGPKLAVSATNPDTVVIMIQDHVRYTHDGGTTWQASGNVDGINGLLERTIEYEFDQLIKSDRVNGDKFYLYATTGKFFKSTDGGANFQEVSTAGLPNRLWTRGNNSATGGGVHMAVAPGLEEEVWLALGASGIWKANGSDTTKTDAFTEITFFRRINPTAVTFGRAAPGSSVPTAYVFGARAVDGLWGIWKSEDLGESWVLATPIDEPAQWPRLLVGDNQTYGRVYVGDASYGIRVLTITSETPEDIIVDNTTADVQGSWSPRTFAPAGQSFVGANYLVNESDQAGRVRYTTDITQAGDYNVYGRWIATARRDSEVSYVVSTGETTDEVTVNQQENGGEWVLLGTYSFEAGSSGYVEVQNATSDGVTIADAVRWEFVTTGVPLRSSGFSAEKVGFTQANLSWFDNAGNEEGFVLERSVNKEEFVVLDTLAPNVTSYSDTTLIFNQTYEYRIRSFNSLGQSSTTSITVLNTEIIVDNSDLDQVVVAGEWAFRNSNFGGDFFGPNFLIDLNEEKGQKSVTYTTPVPVTGQYQVYGRWTATRRRATSVPFIITTAQGIDTVPVNQQENGGEWVLLGSYPLSEAEGATVIISNADTDNNVIADAIRLVYEGEVVPQEVVDLKLTSVCSEDPAAERRWRIRNPNSSPVTVIWEVVSTPQTDTVEALPGDSFFKTATIQGANTTKIYWTDEEGKKRNSVKASGGALCQPDTTTVTNVNSRLAVSTKVEVYPNPASGVLHLRIAEADQLQDLRFIDLSGKAFAIPQSAIGQHTVRLSLDQLKPGVYLLQGTLGQQTFTERILIE